MTTPRAPSPGGPLLRLLGASRYLIFLAVVSILAAGTALLIYGTIQTCAMRRTDLAAAVEFDWGAGRRNIDAIRPGMRIFGVSAKTGEGLADFLGFLADQRSECAQQRTV